MTDTAGLSNCMTLTFKIRLQEPQAVWFIKMVRPYMTYAYRHTVKNHMNAGFAAADARDAAAKAEAERSANG